jgi:hypothetical protein
MLCDIWLKRRPIVSFDPLQSFNQALLTTRRSAPLSPASWPRYADLPLTNHPVPDIA